MTSQALPKLPWVLHFRALGVGVMAACVALAVVDFIHNLAPNWNGAYVAVLCGLAAWEAGYSHHVFNQGHRFLSDRVRFRAIELALFFILLRVFSWLNQPNPAETVSVWLSNPIALFDLEVLLGFGLLLLTWYAATQTLSDLAQIEDPTGIPAQDAPIPGNLTTRFFVGGIAVLVFSGLAHVSRDVLLSFTFAVTYGIVFNVLVYFAVGLILIGQMQLARLQTLWQMQGIKVADELPARWARYTLVFLSLAGLIAFVLPTRYTAGLLGLLSDGFFVIFTFLLFIAYFLLLPFAMLINFLMGLFGVTTGRNPSTQPRPVLPPPPPPESIAAALAPWLDYLRSIVVWVIIVGMVGYVLINYFRERPELLRAVAALRPVRALRRWWAALRGRVGGWMAEVNARLPRDLLQRLLGRSPTAPFQFFRLGAASPREQITYYYLSLLRRAQTQGFARRPAQTPDEYQPTLTTQLPEAQADTEQMTRDFVEARYSPHPLGSEHAQRVRAAWERVRAALRERQRKEHES